MAKNRKYAMSGATLPRVLFIAANARTNNIPLSGDPCRCGQIPGVASADFSVDDGAGVAFIDGIFELLVGGKDSSGTSGADANVNVKGGDVVYFDEAKSPPVSKRSGGIRFGVIIGDHNVEVIPSGITNVKALVLVGG